MSANLLTVDEVAARLSCHPHTVRRWIWSRKLQAVKVGDMVRVPEEEVTRMMRPVAPSRTAESSSAPRGASALLNLMRVFATRLDPDDVSLAEQAIAAARQPADWSERLG